MLELRPYLDLVVITAGDQKRLRPMEMNSADRSCKNAHITTSPTATFPDAMVGGNPGFKLISLIEMSMG